MPQVFTRSENSVSIIAAFSAFADSTVMDVVFRALRIALSAAVPWYPRLISASISGVIDPFGWAAAGMQSNAAARMVSVLFILIISYLRITMRSMRRGTEVKIS